MVSKKDVRYINVDLIQLVMPLSENRSRIYIGSGSTLSKFIDVDGNFKDLIKMIEETQHVFTY